MRLSAVLDNEKAVADGERHYRVHVAHLASVMDHINCFGFWCDLIFDLCRINIECFGINIGIYRFRTFLKDDQRSGNKGYWCDDHFIPLFYLLIVIFLFFN